MLRTDKENARQAAEAFSLQVAEVCERIPACLDRGAKDRHTLAMASFRLAQEHHTSIHLLLSAGKLASAGALVRPLSEAGFRTLWIAEDASDAQLERLLKGKGKIPLLGELLMCVESRMTHRLDLKSRSTLDSLTHSGSAALSVQYLSSWELDQLAAGIAINAGHCLAAAGYVIATLLAETTFLIELTELLHDFKRVTQTR